MRDTRKTPNDDAAWSHDSQVLAALTVLPRATVQELRWSNLVADDVDVPQTLRRLIRDGRAQVHLGYGGDPTHSATPPDRRRLIPLDGSSVASRALLVIKQKPGLSSRAIGREMGYTYPGGAVASVLRQLVASGQVQLVVEPTRYAYYATGVDT